MDRLILLLLLLRISKLSPCIIHPMIILLHHLHLQLHRILILIRLTHPTLQLLTLEEEEEDLRTTSL